VRTQINRVSPTRRVDLALGFDKRSYILAAAAPTIASAVDGEITLVEREIVEAAEAVPENKFNFSPESLNIPGADYKGVRTFGWEIKHVAYSNYVLWSPLTGDKIPEKYSAAAALTAQNLLQTTEGGKSTFLYSR
jgi:hypothetical protein